MPDRRGAAGSVAAQPPAALVAEGANSRTVRRPDTAVRSVDRPESLEVGENREPALHQVGTYASITPSASASVLGRTVAPHTYRCCMVAPARQMGRRRSAPRRRGRRASGVSHTLPAADRRGPRGHRQAGGGSACRGDHPPTVEDRPCRDRSARSCNHRHDRTTLRPEGGFAALPAARPPVLLCPRSGLYARCAKPHVSWRRPFTETTPSSYAA
jgi:hypothetical protein